MQFTKDVVAQVNQEKNRRKRRKVREQYEMNALESKKEKLTGKTQNYLKFVEDSLPPDMLPNLDRIKATHGEESAVYQHISQLLDPQAGWSSISRLQQKKIAWKRGFAQGTDKFMDWGESSDEETFRRPVEMANVFVNAKEYEFVMHNPTINSGDKPYFLIKTIGVWISVVLFLSIVPLLLVGYNFSGNISIYGTCLFASEQAELLLSK